MRSESSFALLLVPSQPGVFALAEEFGPDASVAGGMRMLAILDVAESDDLAFALSRLFAAGSRWRDRLLESRCFVRYAVLPDAEQRRAVAGALRHWLASLYDGSAAIATADVEASSGQVTAPPAFPVGF